MTTQNGRAFNEWLRAQLKAKKMSQRQLAQQSGVDHSTISRLIRGDRMPSLGTATKLARGLRELRDDADTPQYLGLVASGPTNPTARVEYALRADELLPSRRSARSWSTTSPCGCAATAAPSPRTAPTARLVDRPHDRAIDASAAARRTADRLGRVGSAASAAGQSAYRGQHRPTVHADPTAGSPAASSAISRARPGPPSTVRVSGTANAGVWGAGVRDFRGARGVAR